MDRAPLDGQWDKALRDSPYRLRFELGGEAYSNLDQPVPRFIQAFHRAQTVATALFKGAKSITAILATSPLSKDDIFAPAPDGFEAVKALGFRAAPAWCRWIDAFDPTDADLAPLNWCAVDLDDSVMRDTLIWASIAYEMPISPKAPALTFLVDFKAMAMLHVYDDRGMDVSSVDRHALLPLYRTFNDWLLEYDRPRMEDVFGVKG